MLQVSAVDFFYYLCLVHWFCSKFNGKHATRSCLVCKGSESVQFAKSVLSIQTIQLPLSSGSVFNMDMCVL
jgi:hypothetical protein